MSWAGGSWAEQKSETELKPVLGVSCFLTADTTWPVASVTVFHAMTEGPKTRAKANPSKLFLVRHLFIASRKAANAQNKSKGAPGPLRVFLRPHKLLRWLELPRWNFILLVYYRCMHFIAYSVEFIGLWGRPAIDRSFQFASLRLGDVISMTVFPMIPSGPWEVKKPLQALDFCCVVQVKYNLHIL